MTYLTFINQRQTWRLYRGIGSDGALLVERSAMPPLHDLSAAEQPVLWVSSQDTSERQIVQRLTLPDLQNESISWRGGRIGALASAPDGRQAVALSLPDGIDEQPRLWLWNERSWEEVESQMAPGISSKLAWLDHARVVYESFERRLTLLDLNTGRTMSGPPGCCPTVAISRREWYAVSADRVARFPLTESFGNRRVEQATLEGFTFGEVTTLRITHDGQVCTWTEPRPLHRSKGYVQQRGGRRRRFRAIDAGLGAVVGPYDVY
jgi:hypothetical protein